MIKDDIINIQYKLADNLGIKEFFMRINRNVLGILLIIIMLFTTGCVRGDIVLDISRTGSAELSSKLMVVSVLRDNLKPLKEKFAQDGFAIMDVKESGMEGFHAVRTFGNISEMSNLALFKGLNVQEYLQTPKKPGVVVANKTEKSDRGTNLDKLPRLVVDKGLIFNTYKIDVDIDLGKGAGLVAKDDNIIVKNIMSQVDLKFILKLPTKTIKNNAYLVSADGRTLTWRLALGEANQIVAELTMLNLVNIGIIILITILLGGYIYLAERKRKSRGILARRRAGK